MLVTGFEGRRVTRIVVALSAALGTALFVLVAPPGTARADDYSCNPPRPLSVQVAGPNGRSTTEPPGQSVTLTLVDAEGTSVPIGQRCSFGDYDEAVEVSWSTSPDDHQGQVQVRSDVPGSVAYTATVTLHVWNRFYYSYECGSVFLPKSCTTWEWRDGGSFPFADPVSTTITYRDTDPLVAAFAAPGTVPLGNAVSVDGTGSSTDAQATVISWSWDFGDGTHATGATASHLYTTSGTYTITENVGDSLGRTASVTHDVTIGAPSQGGGVPQPPADVAPTSSWTSSPSSPVAGSAVHFDGSPSSDPDGHVVGYGWNFGGGVIDTAVNPTHTFAHAGDYPVTLTVTDDQGQRDSATQTLHVAQAAPTAAFTAPTNATAGAPLSFDGTGSSDPDGSISTWSWDFGDGTPSGSGATPTHAYQHSGTYAVSLTVTDDDGNTDAATHAVSVGRSGPVAAFAAPTAAAAAPAPFDGSPSSDADGTITDWSWDFGDGTTVHGVNPSHPFARAGSFPVTLTVTDDAGLTNSVTHVVAVAGAAPTAAFTAPTASAGTPVTLDGTGSSDPDGSLTGYHWQFGDGTPDADGATPAHSFPAAGSYPVTLTVTDDSGLTGQVTHLVTVGTALPTAAFTGPATATTGQKLAFDGSGSTDPMGAITSWNWTFGDGRSAIGARPTHVFASPGTYPVSLTVVDDAGRIATVTHPVTVRWPATDLAVAASGATPKAGQYTYTITIKNLGKSAAHSVRLLATLDPAQVLAAKPVAPAGLTCAGVPVGATGTVTCKATTATLASGRTWVVKVTVKQPSAPKVGSVTEVSAVDAANPDPVPANDTARITTVLSVKR